jgi:predicted nucleic acid-binding protein
MSYLLDTDICVYWLRGDNAVRKRLAQAGLTEVSISIITLAELYYTEHFKRIPDLKLENWREQN